MIPDWQLPAGVDRGLWDYLHAGDMVRGYDEQLAASPLARADVAFCEEAFPTPGRLIDLGCGTGRLCLHFAAKGFECVGVDLSEAMLAAARVKVENLTPQPPSLLGKGESDLAPLPASGRGRGRGSCDFSRANLTELTDIPDASFDYAACLFSTLGMVRGAGNRANVLANAFRVLKPGGRFVLHAHHRYFRGLGWRSAFRQRWRSFVGRATAGDITMPQAYGGAPLTLHHFTASEVVRLLDEAGFEVLEVRSVNANGEDAGWPFGRRVYGWLLLAGRPR